jgi:hypothetical protein
VNKIFPSFSDHKKNKTTSARMIKAALPLSKRGKKDSKITQVFISNLIENILIL